MLWRVCADGLCYGVSELLFCSRYQCEQILADSLAWSSCHLNLFMPSSWSCLCLSQISDTWSPPDDNCSIYECKKVNNKYITSKKETKCPKFDPDSCVPVSVIFFWKECASYFASFSSVSWFWYKSTFLCCRELNKLTRMAAAKFVSGN